MEVLVGKSTINAAFSNKPCLITVKTTVLGIVGVFYLSWGSHIGDIERPMVNDPKDVFYPPHHGF